MEILWKILPFPTRKAANREEIHSENWVDLNDFLTNGSTSVFVALAHGSGEPPVADGNVVVFDRNLEPLEGDTVVVAHGEGMGIKQYEETDTVLGVVTCVLTPTSAHRRQRTK